MCLTNAEQGGRMSITHPSRSASLDQLVLLFPCGQLVFHQDLLGTVIPQVRFLLWNSMRSLSACFSCLLRSFWLSAQQYICLVCKLVFPVFDFTSYRNFFMMFCFREQEMIAFSTTWGSTKIRNYLLYKALYNIMRLSHLLWWIISSYYCTASPVLFIFWFKPSQAYNIIKYNQVTVFNAVSQNSEYFTQKCYSAPRKGSLSSISKWIYPNIGCVLFFICRWWLLFLNLVIFF